MNKGESIQKYNQLLIKSLNDLVNNLDANGEAVNRIIIDIIPRLREQISEYNFHYNDEMIKKILVMGFGIYQNMLKQYFDNSNIRRIDENIDDSLISKEMNEVSNNLSSAVSNMHKFRDYNQLMTEIKEKIVEYLKINNKDTYDAHDYEVRQVLNAVISGSIGSFLSSSIDDFNKYTLPELFSIGDSITYSETVENINSNDEVSNEDRDKFIEETMDLEIHEDFENGQVTLTIVDSMGTRTKLFGVEAIERLINYNQLYESSRPGRHADTSNWPEDLNAYLNGGVSPTETGPYEKPTGEMEVVNLAGSFESDLMDSNPVQNNMDVQSLENNNVDLNNLNTLTPSEETVNNMNNLLTPPTTEEAVVQDISNNGMVMDTNTSNNAFYDIGEDSTNNNQTPVDINQDLTTKIIENTYNDNNLENNGTTESNNNPGMITTNDYLNAVGGAVVNEVKEEAPIRDEMTTNIINATYGEDKKEEYVPTGSFGFLPEFDNPNEERDNYIKNLTGVTINEDIDNNGLLFLRVVDPHGRETIHTGKEAITMIKNYNKTYESANPGKKADTSLLDKFDN